MSGEAGVCDGLLQERGVIGAAADWLKGTARAAEGAAVTSVERLLAAPVRSAPSPTGRHRWTAQIAAGPGVIRAEPAGGDER